MSFAKRVMQKAFEWVTDYKPWETDLEYREYARHGYVVGYTQACHDHLPEGMEHCTITFHQCPLGHAWLSATNWVQHGCPTCERNELREQSFLARIDKVFQQNLELARDELDCVGEFAEDKIWKLAVEWTQDEIANQIGSYLSQKWWKKMDDINKVFFD